MMNVIRRIVLVERSMCVAPESEKLLSDRSARPVPDVINLTIFKGWGTTVGLSVVRPSLPASYGTF
jgi:hypothetical protein